MVGDKDDYRIFPCRQFLERINEITDTAVRKCDGVYFVENCEWIMDVMNTVDPEDYESLQYFERVLRSSGIISALKEAGINEGDTVSVYDIEFEFVI